jgi:hypothetical protein
MAQPCKTSQETDDAFWVLAMTCSELVFVWPSLLLPFDTKLHCLPDSAAAAAAAVAGHASYIKDRVNTLFSENESRDALVVLNTGGLAAVTVLFPLTAALLAAAAAAAVAAGHSADPLLRKCAWWRSGH